MSMNADDQVQPEELEPEDLDGLTDGQMADYLADQEFYDGSPD